MPAGTIHTEKELLEQIAQGDESAFRQLFHQYWDNIFGVAFLLTRSEPMAEDMVQEIFVKIWEKKDQLPKVGHFKNYLFIVARNHIFNALKKLSGDISFSENLLLYTRDSALSPEQLLLKKESEHLIRQAIDRLPGQQQAAYLLARTEGLSHEEIAERLGISKNTVRNHMARALKSIRTYLLEHAGSLLLPICLFNALLPVL